MNYPKDLIEEYIHSIEYKYQKHQEAFGTPDTFHIDVCELFTFFNDVRKEREKYLQRK